MDAHTRKPDAARPLSTRSALIGGFALAALMLTTPLARAHSDDDHEDRREAWEDYYEARSHAYRGHFRRALDDIDEALEEMPDEERFRLTKAFILLDLGRDAQAIPILEDLMENSKSTMAADARHELEHIGHIPPPEGDHHGASMKSPPMESAASGKESTGSMTRRSSAGGRARHLAWKHYEYGRHLAQMGWLEKAMRPLDRSIQLWPEEGRFYLTRGLVQFDLGHREDAVKDLRKAQEKGYGWVQRRAADELELMGEAVEDPS